MNNTQSTGSSPPKIFPAAVEKTCTTIVEQNIPHKTTFALKQVASVRARSCDLSPSSAINMRARDNQNASMRGTNKAIFPNDGNNVIEKK